MKPSEARDKIIMLLKTITNDRLRRNALRAANDYFRTRSIVEKKVYMSRVITFYSEWLKNRDSATRKHEIERLRKLLLVARK